MRFCIEVSRPPSADGATLPTDPPRLWCGNCGVGWCVKRFPTATRAILHFGRLLTLHHFNAIVDILCPRLQQTHQFARIETHSRLMTCRTPHGTHKIDWRRPRKGVPSHQETRKVHTSTLEGCPCTEANSSEGSCPFGSLTFRLESTEGKK